MREASTDTWRDVAERFKRGAETRDISILEPLYHPDATFWNNVLGRTSTTRDVLELTRLESQRIDEYLFEDVRCTGTDDGFVLQITVTGRTHTGEQFRVPGCLVVTVDDGRIRHIDEYVDSSQAAPVFAALLGSQGVNSDS